MMWYGRMTFRLKVDEPEVGRAETRSALLLIHALRTAEAAGRPALELWADLYNAGVFFVGRSDDLTVLQYGEVVDEVYGREVSVTGLTDEELLDTFIEEAGNLPPPRILGLVIRDIDDEEAMTKGLRFMGQRFVPDAYIFSQLVHDKVGTREHRRGLPMGLDLLAAMSSERAYRILEEVGETDYEKYPAQMAEIRNWVSDLSVEEWTETLYNAWLYSFRTLLEVPGEGAPSFMQSPAWVDKQLHTALGSWAELKHDTILYAKQGYCPLCGGGAFSPEPVPPKGYVEPVPRFYSRLAALTAMTRQGLRARGMLSSEDDGGLGRFEELARAFQIMAEKELYDEPLTEEEHALIRDYGQVLERLASGSSNEGEEPERQAAVVADVATDLDPDGDGDPNPVVLEEAVGWVDEIHVVVPVVEEDGTTTLQEVAKGGVFSYYEFPWPADNRLTDEKWREMLEEDQAPPRPAWIESFFSLDTEYSDLTDAIYWFERALGEVFYFLDADLAATEEDAVREQLAAQVAPLRAQQLYEGRQLVSRNIRSVDLQTEGRAVVAAHETWQDSLGEFRKGTDDQWGEPIAQRGPYTLDVTYTLERDEWGWQVTDILYATSPPAW